MRTDVGRIYIRWPFLLSRTAVMYACAQYTGSLTASIGPAVRKFGRTEMNWPHNNYKKNERFQLLSLYRGLCPLDQSLALSFVQLLRLSLKIEATIL